MTRAMRLLAVSLLLAVTTPAPATAAEQLVIRGRVIDSDGEPVADATLAVNLNYGLILSSGGLTVGLAGGVGAAGDPSCGRPGDLEGGCIPVSVTTGADGRFNFEAPADLVRRRDEIEKGDTSGFTLTAEAPAAAGETRGPVVQISHRLERDDDEIELPTLRLWRPELRLEPVGATEVRLRWSRLPRRSGRLITEARPGVTPDPMLPARRTGPAAFRVDLRGTPPGSAWFVTAKTQVGDESNVTFSSAALPLPAGPTSPSRGKPCVVIGTAGGHLRGAPCAATDGDRKAGVGSVFPDTCRPDDVFCERELPSLVAVDLGAVSALSFVDVASDCFGICDVVVSSDGRSWREVRDRPVSECARGDLTILSSGRIVLPPGTQARYVGVTAQTPEDIPVPRAAARPLPTSSPALDLHGDTGGFSEFDAVVALEITVFTGTPVGTTCDDVDQDVAFLGPPAQELARERNTVAVRVLAGILAFAVAVAAARALQQARMRTEHV